MPHYQYLIIGGGMTADAAARAIREIDHDGAVGIVSAEPDAPYDRPPLSKGLWKGTPQSEIWRRIEQAGVELHLGRTVRALEPQNRRVVDRAGTVYTYGKLLLATGGTPRRLSFDGERIIYFRTLQDYRRLRELADRGHCFAVIGAGFIGAEIAAALAMNGRDVILVFPEAELGGNRFPPDLGRFLTEFYRQKGVEVVAHHTAVGLEPRGDRLALTIQGAKGTGARTVTVDGVVAGIGIEPNVELARAAGLEVGDGIIVDELLRTTGPDIWAAGDVAAFHNPQLGKRLRVEHEDNANAMGRFAGHAMAGADEPYRYLPFFYSDLFELGYEAVGELDARHETFADWKEPFRKGVVYYVHGGRVRGVLLWNVWNQVDAARRLIAEPGPVHPGDLRGRLPF